MTTALDVTDVRPSFVREGASTLPSTRSLVLVVGSGRSGTSAFSGILQRLGYHVPTPEVPADSTNPKGFAESKWVVDFHTALLKLARVQTADARPSAWADTAAVSGERAASALRTFLRRQFALSDHVLIKDPRLPWFLPLWRRCSTELGVSPRFVATLRHPAAVVASKSQNYGPWQGDASRAAGWLNTMLYVERATRDGLRVFVRYEDLLTDWTKAVASVADKVQLDVIADASPGAIRAADAFVDQRLQRVAASWSGLQVPEPLLDQVEQAWRLLERLGDKDAKQPVDVSTELDCARERYIAYYRQAEAVAESSINASVRAGQGRRSAGFEALVTRWVPDRYRRRVPVRWRRAVLAVMGQRGRG
jgi:hypothetical protein